MRTTSLHSLLTATVLVAVSACDSTTPPPPAETHELDLAVGEVRMLTGSIGAIGLQRPGEYLLVPLLASTAAGTEVPMTLGTEGIGSPSAPFLSSLGAATAPTTDADRAAAAHIHLQHRFRRELEPRLRHLREDPAALGMPAVVGPSAQEGDVISLSVSTQCDAEDDREGRVVVRSDRALVVEEVGMDLNGYTEADYRTFAEVFDSHIHPLAVTNFGEPVDLDASNRVVIFFTRAVNELSDSIAGAGALITGYVWQGDVLPASSCASSNERGIFYMAVPDGVGNRTRGRMLPLVEGTLVHELQHLINAGRTIHVHGGTSFETVWMEEGLSHTAEELLFFRRSGLSPRSNIDLATLTSDESVRRLFERLQGQNFIRLSRFLESPETTVFIDPQVPLSTRGALWQFFRYMADRRGGEEAAFWRALVNTNRTGFENLSHALGTEPYDWIHDWAVSVYTDDLLSVEPRYTQPSWDFRSIFPGMQAFDAYPLDVRTLDGTAQLTLRTGAPVYYRFRVMDDTGGRIEVERPTGDDRLRFGVVRVQ